MYQAILGAKYFGITLLMTVLPSETIMPLAGYRASAGDLWLPGVVLAGAVGTTVGSTALYVIARSVSHREVARLSDRYGKWLGISAERIDHAGALFDDHAKTTIFLGRFVPGIRSAVSIPAGYQRMPAPLFVFVTFIGGALNSAMLAAFGYYASGSVSQSQGTATVVSYAVGGVVVLFALGFLIVRRVRSKKS